MEQFLSIETLVIELLLIVSVVAVGVRRFRVPYTVSLVLVGLLLTIPAAIQVELTPELILALFVPPLVFEAAFHIDLRELRNDLGPILMLAVPGVLLTTVVVGWIVAASVGLSLASALVFGALISATDPVAVVALFRSLGAPRRLSLLVEGESLFNDGTAIVVFGIMLGAAGAAAQHGGAGVADNLDLVGAVTSFLVVALGGVAAGALLGWLVAGIIGRVDDHLVETTLTTVVAFGAYIVAERLHVSGVLAVVAAGIVSGNFGPQGMSPTTRIVVSSFWEYVAFLANSLVFLLIGLELDIGQLTANVWPILMAVVAVLASRAIVVYGLTWLLARRWHLPGSYRHVMFWGGLRGAISLALALSLPAALPQRSLLQAMAFGVVLFTLLIQGTSMQFLMDRLGLVRRTEPVLEFERRHGRVMAARAGRARLEAMTQAGTVSATTVEQLGAALDTRLAVLMDEQAELLASRPDLQAEALHDARVETLRAERAALTGMLRDGQISEHVYNELLTEVDKALSRDLDASARGEATSSRGGVTPPVLGDASTVCARGVTPPRPPGMRRRCRAASRPRHRSIQQADINLRPAWPRGSGSPVPVPGAERLGSRPWRRRRRPGRPRG